MISRYIFKLFPKLLTAFIVASGFCQAEPPVVSAVGDQIYCPQTEQNIVTAFNIVDNDSNSTSGFYIQISSGYAFGEDQLSLTGSHPNIVSSWNAAQAKLTLSPATGSSILYTDIINAVNDVVFFSTNINIEAKTFSLTIGEANFLDGHYYDFIPSYAIPWTTAKVNAESMSYYGLQGYLATITNAAEAQICGELSPGTGWIGATDAQSEGVWKWVTGPEANTVFWNGNQTGSAPAGMYSNWNSGEPNNAGSGEDYAHITDVSVTTNPGSWNDLPNNTAGQPVQYTATGFVIEYGGMPGDPTINISASTYFSPAEILTTSPSTSCENETAILQATSNTTDILWYDEQFGGALLATGNSYSPTLSSNQTFWVLASNNGCEAGVRVAVDATVTPLENTIFDPIDPICEGDSNPLPATDINGVTGSWTPAFDATTTTDYSFTPDPGQCATTPAPVQVVVNPIITTTFDPIDPICEGDSNPLPATDINGITGSWTPAFDATTTTDYSFTPDAGQCATTPAPVQVVVNPIITTTFDPIDPICAGDSIAPLPTTSNNGITGTWNPATIDNTTTDVYTFTPDAGVCVIPTTIEITVLQQITPTFLIDDICIGESTAQLPVVSEENISGSWSPSTVNNLITTTYTFTPDPGQCANTTTETINVNPINTLSIATENTSAPFDSNQIIEVTVTGGSGNYEYQLDGGIWQNNPVFQNVIGCQEHIVKVRDEEGCSNEPESVVTILSYPKFFTPNGDGYNDFWNIECLKNRTGLISIFDRFGKLLKQFKTTSSGWNGSYNNTLMPTSDYWFMVRYFDENGLEKEFRSHFTLRR